MKHHLKSLSNFVLGALGATRTRGPLLRKQMLYPLSYEGVEGILIDLLTWVNLSRRPESTID